MRRQLPLILLVAIVAAGAAYVWSRGQTKKYSATGALLFVNSHLDEQLFGNQVISNNTDPTRQAATNAALVQLPEVARLVANQLHISPARVASEITLGSDAQSDVLTVTATDRQPARAALLANTYVVQFISFRKTADQSQLQDAQKTVSQELAAIPPVQRGSATAQQLQSRSNELAQLAALQTGDAQQVQTAAAPTSPSSPTPVRDAVIGGLLGLLIGGLLAFVLERRDRRLKTATEVEELYGLPVIGTVALSKTLRRAGALGTPREQDAFLMMRAQLRYFDVDRDIKRVMITSADSGEGKSLVALNLARAAARADGKRALLIETDLRRPSLGRTLGLDNVAGLGELLSHSQDLASGLRELVVTPQTEEDGTQASRLDVLLAGGTPPNPAELLESRRMVELMDYAGSIYDIVIIDTPPIGIVSDPIPLVHQVDGVLVISRLGRSRRDHASRLLKQLRGLNAQVLGVVINGFQSNADGYYGYYGYYGTDGDSAANDQSPRRRLPGRSRQTTKSR
jgi:capsular exopolysaccharide synthesis family protein